jgi:hypothetical protein
MPRPGRCCACYWPFGAWLADSGRSVRGNAPGWGTCPSGLMWTALCALCWTNLCICLGSWYSCPPVWHYRYVRWQCAPVQFARVHRCTVAIDAGLRVQRGPFRSTLPGTYEAPASLIYVAYKTYVCQTFFVSTGLMAPSSIDINPIRSSAQYWSRPSNVQVMLGKPGCLCGMEWYYLMYLWSSHVCLYICPGIICLN